MEGKILYYFVLLAVLSSQCCFVDSIRGTTKRSARRNEYRFIVPILRVHYSLSLSDNILCTGTLLSNYHILTADHCFYHIHYNQFRVLIGSNHINHNGEFYPMWFMSFEQWSWANGQALQFSDNDISIIKIFNSVPYRLTIPALSDLWPITRLFGLQVTIAGWGEISFDVRPEKLQIANVTIISYDACRDRTTRVQGYPSPLPPTFMCSVANPSIVVAFGDSGGPVLYNGEIIGITVGVSPRIEAVGLNPNSVNVHIGISYFRAFIDALLLM